MLTAVERLIRYTAHDIYCHAQYQAPDHYRCTCGLAAAVADVRQAQKPAVDSGRELMKC